MNTLTDTLELILHTNQIATQLDPIHINLATAPPEKIHLLLRRYHEFIVAQHDLLQTALTQAQAEGLITQTADVKEM